MIKTFATYFPRIGPKREYKNALEFFWEKKISTQELIERLNDIQKFRVRTLYQSGIDIIPSDFTYYDSMLDLCVMFNCVPNRFSHIRNDLELYFALARGDNQASALEMTKWFDTNYHYIVPELDGNFKLQKNLVIEKWKSCLEFGFNTTPIIIGPFTFISLGKINDNGKWVKPQTTSEFRNLLLHVAKEYNILLKQLSTYGIQSVIIDEPALVLDYDKTLLQYIFDAYHIVSNECKIKLIVNTYYESLSFFHDIVENLPVDGFGLDLTFRENIENLARFGLPKEKIFIAGIINGRSPFKDNLVNAKSILEELSKKIPLEQIILSNAQPLMHLPTTLELEDFDPHIKQELAFAKEKLSLLKLLADAFNKGTDLKDISDHSKTFSISIENIQNLNPQRKHSFKERFSQQMKLLNLPLFPTTTIGSFPQTQELRKKRADFNSGKITQEDYERYIKGQIKQVIKLQEDLNIDVLVHGEFERSDMVEFFAQKLDGFLITKHGWVISYGSRAIRPPIIYSEIKRVKPLTIKEISYAQSLTKKFVKGMLTGPITLLNWSFVKSDVPKQVIAYQLALALKEEVMELEKAGIKIIQIDEPAFREGMPLKKHKQKDYLEFASKIFRFVVEDVDKLTQIHTHMCYSEFDEIIEYIYKMDADCISIEASRSKGDIISAFEKFKYDHAIGLGVYDIHSPRVPSVEEMMEIVQRALCHIDKELFWVNPDCGLKTRKYEEVIPALKNMVEVAHILRKKYIN